MSTDDRTQEMPAASTGAQAEVIPAAGEEHEPTLANLPAVEAEPASATPLVTLAVSWPFWDSMDGKERAEGILPCTGCGAEFTDERAAACEDMHDYLRQAAGLAGWGLDGNLDWLCPECSAQGSSDEEAWPVLEDDATPGTPLYEERLKLHVAAMKDISDGIRDSGPEIHDPAVAALHAITLRIADVADIYGVRDRIGVAS